MNAQPSHGDLLDEVRQNRAVASEVKQTCEHLMHRMDDQARHNALVISSLQSLFQKAEDTEAAVGEIRAKVLKYDLLSARFVGAIGAFTVAFAALWWLVKAKIAALFGVAT